MKKKYIIIIAALVFAIGMFTSCGDSSSSGDESATEATTQGKTVTAEEAAKAADSAKETTEDPGTPEAALSAVEEAASKDIEGFDGNMEDMHMSVDEPIATISFESNGEHYTYSYNMKTGELVGE